MTRTETDLVRHALETLRRLVPDIQGREGGPVPECCPVERFAQKYLAHDPATDVSCAELWTFFREIVNAGELPPMRKAVFLHRLPGVMESVFGARKCHSIERADRRVRGFRGIGIRLDASPPAGALEIEG